MMNYSWDNTVTPSVYVYIGGREFRDTEVLSFDINENIIADNKLSVCNICNPTISLKLANISNDGTDNTDVLNQYLINESFLVYIKSGTGAGTNDIPLGVFRTTSVSVDTIETTIQGEGRFSNPRFTGTYNSGLDWGQEHWVLDELVDDIDAVDNIDTSVLSPDFLLPTNSDIAFEGKTVKEMLGAVASLYCVNVYLNRQGKPQFKPIPAMIDNPDITLTSADLFSFTPNYNQTRITSCYVTYTELVYNQETQETEVVTGEYNYTIANAIRSKNGSSDTYTISQMSSAIDNIPSGGGGTPNFPINNNKNNFWIVISEPNTSVSVTGSGTIDWGDETQDTNTSHTYANIGMYCIQGSGISSVSYNQLFAEFNVGNSVPSYQNDTSIKKVKIGNQITSINYNTFYNCTALTSINLANVQEITGGAFGNCTSLSGHLDISQTTLTGYSDSSDNGAFMGCTGITSVTIGAIEPYDSNKRNAAFKGCTGLTTATVSGGTSTGRATFSGCSSLRTVYLPDTITEISNYSFERDSNLTLYIRAITPPTVLDSAFASATVSAIYVPAESVDTYKTASGWSTYASVIQAIPND